MQGSRNTLSFFLPGTLAANHVIAWTLQRDTTLRHISVTAQNNSDATLKLGTSADDDAYLAAIAIGDSGTPVTFDRDNWVDTSQDPLIRAGTTLVATLDFDGPAAGTAAQNVTIVFDFED